MIDLDEFRQASRESWSATAGGWEKRREWLLPQTAPVHDWIVAHADPQPGETFLDVAGGTGDLALMVAERVGDGGRVIGSDFAPEMVDIQRRVGAASGVGNVDHRVLDAERMDLEDDSVDGVVSRFGYMLIADPAAAFSETRRVLRPGGRFSFAVWATPDRNPWAAVPFMTLVQREVVPPPEPGAPGIFALGMPERIRELITGAGFEEPEIEEIAFQFRYADDDDLWGALTDLAGGLSRAIAALPAAEREAARAAIVENSASHRNDDGSYTTPASAWGVLAR